MADIKLLDCTLRDGGYINEWNWGEKTAKAIISSLIKANIDIIEIGFLRNIDKFNRDVSVANRIEELKSFIPTNNSNTIFSAMVMQSNYDIDKLSEWSPMGIDMIRVTAHDYDIIDGLEFAKKVKEKGYKLSINPINIMGYSDDRILWLIENVNAIMPYQFSIVDTFGSMTEKDMVRIVSLIDHNMDKSIRLGLHLHENMAQSFSLAQHFLMSKLERSITIDASLMGMGRIPGNLSIELIAEYLNEHFEGKYHLDYIIDSIYDYIEPIKRVTPWGYTPAYFLSAKYNLHRNYAEYYLSKGDLTTSDINHILARIGRNKACSFDVNYAEKLYMEYESRMIDDACDRIALKSELQGKEILVIAPGSSLIEKRDTIDRYILTEKPIVFTLNFIMQDIDADFAFFSNNKRYKKSDDINSNIVVTSNVNAKNAKYNIDFNSISGAFTQGCNSMILLLNLLKQLGIHNISLAGADGYKSGEKNYYDTSLRNVVEHGREFNQEVAEAIKKVGINVKFITESEYQRYL